MAYITVNNNKPLGAWSWSSRPAVPPSVSIHDALLQIEKPVFLVNRNGAAVVFQEGQALIGESALPAADTLPLMGWAPPLPLEHLGDRNFKNAHGIRYPLIGGAMANGITSTRMVETMGRAGMMGFFGAGGLRPSDIESAIEQIQTALGSLPYGFNLIHSPYDPALEAATVDLYLKKGVRRVSAAAFLDLTPALVYYRVKGLRRDADGRVVCQNQVIAKVSRIEVARKFLSPAPEKILSALVADGRISSVEAELAETVPMADDLTAEADSGGHTDNRPAISLLPTLTALRDAICAKHRYPRPICVGLGGGIATPAAVSAAFAMGAAYVLTGTINQACIESGTSDAVRRMLAEANQADVTMAPSADMFEMGVKVQVLKRGTMFPQRAAKLYELYGRYHDIDALPAEQKQMLERQYFRQSIAAEWEETRLFFKERDPAQIVRAEKDSRHKMALLFRSYLGQSALWAKRGVPDRTIDYQVWCGPGIGAFNEWVRGSFLEPGENRQVEAVSMNLLMGATVLMRRNTLLQQGNHLPATAGHFRPLPLSALPLQRVA